MTNKTITTQLATLKILTKALKRNQETIKIKSSDKVLHQTLQIANNIELDVQNVSVVNDLFVGQRDTPNLSSVFETEKIHAPLEESSSNQLQSGLEAYVQKWGWGDTNHTSTPYVSSEAPSTVATFSLGWNPMLLWGLGLAAHISSGSKNNETPANISSGSKNNETPANTMTSMVTVTSNVDGIATSDILYTITFSKAVKGFDVSKISSNVGILSSFAPSADGKIYTIVLTLPADESGTARLAIITTGVTDDSGNTVKAPEVIEQAYATSSNVLQGAVVAGPVTGGLEVGVFDVNGNKLGSEEVDGTGAFTINLGLYTGPVYAVVKDINGDIPNYISENAGTEVDMKSTLLAVTNIGLGGNLLYITPLTTLMAIKAGVSVDANSGVVTVSGLTAESITNGNKAVAQAFGLSDNITTSKPITTLEGDSNDYGCVLAAIEGAGGNDTDLLNSLANDIDTNVNSAVLNLNAARSIIKGATAIQSTNLTSKVGALLNKASNINTSIDIKVIAGNDVVGDEDDSLAVSFKVNGEPSYIKVNSTTLTLNTDYTFDGPDTQGYYNVTLLPSTNAITRVGGYKMEVTTASGTASHMYSVVDKVNPSAYTLTTKSGEDANVNANEAWVNVEVTYSDLAIGDSIQLISNDAYIGGLYFVKEADVIANKVTIAMRSSDLGADGEKVISALVKDASGNTGSPGNKLILKVDTTPPSAITVTASIHLPTNLNDGEVGVSGLEPSAMWQYSTDGGASWIIGNGSSFKLASGTYNSVKVRQFDFAGNVSAVNNNLTDISINTKLIAAYDKVIAAMSTHSNPEFTDLEFLVDFTTLSTQQKDLFISGLRSAYDQGAITNLHTIQIGYQSVVNLDIVYASSSGSILGDGSSSNPWSLEDAAQRSRKNSIIIALNDGTYQTTGLLVDGNRQLVGGGGTVAFEFTPNIKVNGIISGESVHINGTSAYQGVLAWRPGSVISGFTATGGVSNLGLIGEVADVFLQSGQSNSVGAESVGNYPAKYPTATEFGKLWSINQTFMDLNKLNAGGIKPETMTDDSQHGFGLVIALAMNLDVALGKEYYIVKIDQGGRWIRSWLSGSYDETIIDQTLNAVKYLASKGKVPILSNFIWFQGENDAYDGLAVTYPTNFQELLNSLNSRMGLSLDTTLIGLRVYEPSVALRFTQFIQMQELISNKNKKITFVSSADLRQNGELNTDSSHYGPDNYFTIGDRIFQALDIESSRIDAINYLISKLENLLELPEASDYSRAGFEKINSENLSYVNQVLRVGLQREPAMSLRRINELLLNQEQAISILLKNAKSVNSDLTLWNMAGFGAVVTAKNIQAVEAQLANFSSSTEISTLTLAVQSANMAILALEAVRTGTEALSSEKLTDLGIILPQETTLASAEAALRTLKTPITSVQDVMSAINENGIFNLSWKEIRGTSSSGIVVSGMTNLAQGQVVVLSDASNVSVNAVIDKSGAFYATMTPINMTTNGNYLLYAQVDGQAKNSFYLPFTAVVSTDMAYKQAVQLLQNVYAGLGINALAGRGVTEVSLEDFRNAGLLNVTDENLQGVLNIWANYIFENNNIQTLSQAVEMSFSSKSRIESYNRNHLSATTPPTESDYLFAGVQGVTINNLLAVNKAVFDAAPGGADTLARIQGFVTQANKAIEKIKAYASSDGLSASPSVVDYTTIGLTSVTSANLSQMNSAVLKKEASEVETLPQIAALIPNTITVFDVQRFLVNSKITYVISGVASANYVGHAITLTVNADSVNAETSTALVAANGSWHVSVDSVTSMVNPGVSLSLSVSVTDGVTPAKVSFKDEPFALSSNDLALLRTTNLMKIGAYADGDGNNPGPLLLDVYLLAGIYGVNEDNIGAVNAAVLASANKGADSVVEINNLVIAANSSLEQIKSYASGVSNAELTVAQYQSVGLRNINENNIKQINKTIRGVAVDYKKLIALDALAERITEAVGTIVNYISGSFMVQPTLDDYGFADITGVNANNIAVINDLIGTRYYKLRTPADVEQLVMDASTGLVIADTIDNRSNPLAAITYHFKFKADLTGFTTDNLLVTGGHKGAFVQNSSSEYTLLVTPYSGDGDPIGVKVVGGAGITYAGGESLKIGVNRTSADSYLSSTASMRVTDWGTIDTIDLNALRFTTGGANIQTGQGTVRLVDRSVANQVSFWVQLFDGVNKAVKVVMTNYTGGGVQMQANSVTKYVVGVFDPDINWETVNNYNSLAINSEGAGYGIANVVALRYETSNITPTLSGTLSSALSAGQELAVYVGNTSLGSVMPRKVAGAVVFDGLNWTFTPTVGLPTGITTLTTVVQATRNKSFASKISTIRSDMFDIDSSYTPVILDMNHDGLIDYSYQLVDVSGDGHLALTAWAKSVDGVLFVDKNFDGKVSGAREFAFGDTAKGLSDLQGLALDYDNNHDGKLDAKDSEFNLFNVWQDLNGDGASQSNEVQSLTMADIKSLSLTGDGIRQSPMHGVIEAGRTAATLSNNSAIVVADVSFSYSLATVLQGVDTSKDIFTISEVLTQIKGFNESDGDVIVLSDLLSQLHAAGGNVADYVQTVQQGNNTIIQVDATGHHDFTNASNQVVLINTTTTFCFLQQQNHLVI